MKISEAAKKYNLTADTLRYYEKEGLLPNVKKNQSGMREYSQDDLNWIEFIKCMRGAGLSVEILKKYINLFFKGDDTLIERKNLLIEQRLVLQEKFELMKSTLEKLDYKIEQYEKLFVPCEQKLKQ